MTWPLHLVFTDAAVEEYVYKSDSGAFFPLINSAVATSSAVCIVSVMVNSPCKLQQSPLLS